MDLTSFSSMPCTCVCVFNCISFTLGPKTSILRIYYKEREMNTKRYVYTKLFNKALFIIMKYLEGPALQMAYTWVFVK